MRSTLSPHFVRLACVIVTITLTFAQDPAAGRLVVKAALVADDLSLKPVPKWPFALVSDSTSEEIVLTTSFSGEIRVDVAPGSYKLVSKKPVELGTTRFSWSIPVAITTLEESVIELSNDNAIEEKIQTPAARVPTSEGKLYNELKGGVFEVLSDFGHGTGFLVDEAGLVATNRHVVANSRYLAVHCDETHKYPAVLVVADSSLDVAVLRVHPDAVKGLPVLRLAEDSAARPPVQVGDRVLAIGNPLEADTILTSGIVSKVEEGVLHSDVNINQGNSGGPLFDMRGEVVGITTFGQSGQIGPGVSGIVRAHVLAPLISTAKAKLSMTDAPLARLLPVASSASFPVADLKKFAATRAFDPSSYHIEAGRMDVQLLTPMALASLEVKEEREAAEFRSKRTRGKKVESYEVGSDFYEWRRYVGVDRPVVIVQAVPEIAMTGGSVFAVIMLGPNVPVRYKFKTDFDRMELVRDGVVIEPIHPGRVPNVASWQAGFASMQDVGFFGSYVYPPEAFKPGAAVELRIWEQGRPQPKVRDVKADLLQRIWGDFRPFFDNLAREVAGKPSEVPGQFNPQRDIAEVASLLRTYLESHTGWQEEYPIRLETGLSKSEFDEALAHLVQSGTIEFKTTNGIRYCRRPAD